MKKNRLNLFIFIATQCLHWEVDFNVMDEQRCIIENPATYLSVEIIHGIPYAVKLLEKGEKSL